MNGRFNFRIRDTILHDFIEKEGLPAIFIGDSRFIIQQCTDISDKKGKLIYEGDIILNPEATEPENTGWIVKWIDHGFYLILIGGDKVFDSSEKNKFIPFNNISNEFEIIGNIFDNQELLK